MSTEPNLAELTVRLASTIDEVEKDILALSESDDLHKLVLELRNHLSELAFATAALLDEAFPC